MTVKSARAHLGGAADASDSSRAMRSRVACTSGVCEVIRVSPPRLNRKSQWLQPSASVWVRIKPHPSPSLSATSDRQMQGEARRLQGASHMPRITGSGIIDGARQRVSRRIG